MIPRRVRYECPKCGRRESHTEGCVLMPRICPKCKLPLAIKETSFGSTPTLGEIVDVLRNLLR